MTIRRVITASLVAATAFLSVLSYTTVANAGGVLKIAREQDSTTFDPIFTILAPDIWVLNQFYSKLVRDNADATDVIPDLAESWQVSPDGKTYTFNLRSAVFSDGTPVKSSDVVFSLKRVRDAEQSIMAGLYTVMTDVHAPDDETVVITLSSAAPSFMSTLAMFASAIVPEHAVEVAGEDFGQNPIGSGPFILKEWKRGNKVVLEKNSNYWEEGLPKLDGIEWIYAPNDNTRMLKLTAGEVDAATFVPWNQIRQLQDNPKTQVQIDKSTRMDHILINHNNAPLDNKAVRQALNMAIDQDAIVEKVTFGFGVKANSFFPLDGMYYNKNNPNYSYDPEKAKAILADEGVTNLELDFVIVSGDSAHEQTAVLVKAQCAKAGITVNIVKMEGGQQWDALVAGEYDLGMMWWVNDVSDPDQKAQFVVSGDEENRSYYTNYKNPEVTKLVNEAALELDPDKRKQMYYKIQSIAKDDVHWIDLYYSPFRNASLTSVTGFIQNPLGRYMLTTADKQ